MKPASIFVFAILFFAVLSCNEIRQQARQVFEFATNTRATVSEKRNQQLLLEISKSRAAAASMIALLDNNAGIRAKAVAIQQQTDQVIKYLQTFRKELVAHTDVQYHNGHAVNLNRSHGHHAFTIGQNHDGAAFQLYRLLSRYHQQMRHTMQATGFSLVKSQEEELPGKGIVMENEAQFARLCFEQKTSLECLDYVRELQATLARQEKEAIALLFVAGGPALVQQ